ncbi:MAG: aromatic ring-hydroxylating dioxygenase subunit alpha [Clostridia bacterium]|nr:aromatic ring-hydroxylating dioxygenase subunit alpha [Clostridia bacterium]
MIRNQWYVVLESRKIKRKPVGLVRFNEKLVFWRDEDNKVHCIHDICCHRGASLSKGCVHKDMIACPFHGFEYDATGQVKEIPALGKNYEVPKDFRVKAYPVREAYDLIWMWYGEMGSETDELHFFDDLKSDYFYSGFSEVWPVHYTRAIENQLDVVHLPFVHKTTIGKGMGKVVNGPVVKWSENRMTFYVNNVEDHGQAALKASEIKNYESLFQLQFQMPNTWQNIISDRVRIFAAFVPIDDHHTEIIIRMYQQYIKVPILGKFLGYISNYFNKIILHQDRDVVMTQIPDRTDLKMHEKLIPGDLPIIEYRKKRNALLNLDVKTNHET